MGVEDIIGESAVGNSTNSTEPTGLPTLIAPDVAVLVYGIWACSQFVMALFIYTAYPSRFTAVAGATSRTLYTWVWLSGFIGMLVAWFPPAVFWPVTIFWPKNKGYTTIFLYAALLSLDGPAIFYFIPLILLLYCNTTGIRSGLIVASKT